MRSPSHPWFRSSRWSTSLVWLAPLALLLASGGCVGLTAQILYAIKGEKVPAEFEGLAGKRVAVVCVANTSNYDPGTASSTLAQLTETILKQHVDKIKVVRQEKVADWIDNHDWNQVDYLEIGKGLQAEMVVGIDLDGYRLHEDATMYKGKANVTVSVFDIKKGEAVFKKHIPNYMFPINGGQHQTETTEQQFQRKFLVVLAQDIAKLFYAYEFKDDFARDATMLHQ